MSELEDHVEQICATVEALRDVAGDGPRTRKLLESLFRKVHNLKAAASANGLEQLSAMAHEFENTLHSLRTGKTSLDDEALAFLTETCDTLFENLPAHKPALASETIPDEIWNSLKESERHSLRQSIAEGANLFLVQTSFDVADFERQFHSLKASLSKSGEIISTAPKVDQSRAGQINFRILYARLPKLVKSKPSWRKSQALTSPRSMCPRRPMQRAPQRTTAADSVRINLDDLDRIIARPTNSRRETIGALSAGETAAGAIVSQPVRRLVNLRMVPVARLLQRAVRAGRSAAARPVRK